ncbi:MAG TPA: TrbG/VirB9 family P-type conjugative transfer protein [Candidatus Acidoferrum sp.]|nr:TrbG/VirB9 family P-type conjugative transfer protein [Candidatus Acidoferrum sp.]
MKNIPTFRSSCRLPLVLAAAIAILGVGQLAAWAATDTARVVKYGQNDIVPVKAKLRFSTLIILPEKEEILDFTTGDKEFWIINGAHNLCYIHPAQAGIRSNLNLITASGHVYSFLLEEVSKAPNAEPDLKIFVEPKEQSGVGGSAFGQRFVSATEAEAYKREIQTVRDQSNAQVQAAEANANAQVEKFRSEYPSKLQFDYRFASKATAQPFLISAIYHDDAFTYIRCAASEKPAIYELKDGKPNLINFDLVNGTYIVPKIVDSGYLAIGKKKLAFARQQ